MLATPLHWPPVGGGDSTTCTCEPRSRQIAEALSRYVKSWFPRQGRGVVAGDIIPGAAVITVTVELTGGRESPEGSPSSGLLRVPGVPLETGCELTSAVDMG